MKYGLALEGGGAKGAYEIGSFFALDEKYIPIEKVVGTSIGAYNAALICQGDKNLMLGIWTGEYYGANFDEEYSNIRERLEERERGNIFALIRETKLKNSEFLRQLLDRTIQEDLIRDSGIDYGCVLYSITRKRTRIFTLSDIPQGELCDYILASCSHPISFSPVRIGKEYFADGGIGNNLPYRVLLEEGYFPIIFRANPNRGDEFFPKQSLVVAPKSSLGHTMHFSPKNLINYMIQGYEDAREVLKDFEVKP